jgi:hypothetical protein
MAANVPGHQVDRTRYDHGLGSQHTARVSPDFDLLFLRPRSDFSWSRSYPYGQTFTQADNDAADIALLDTNRNGVLDADDDSLSPYWPGDDYVDWVGVSLCRCSSYSLPR